MALKRDNNLLTSCRWYNKDPKDYQILVIVGVSQKLLDNSNKLSEKNTRETTKGNPDYIRYLPPWILSYPKGLVGNKTRYGK